MLHVQYVSIDDFLITTTQKKTRYNRPLVDLGELLLRCWALAWLNDCANGYETIATLVEMRKMQSL